MSYPYPKRIRPVLREVHGQDIGPVTCTATTVAATVNLPAGAYVIGFTVMASGTSDPIVVKAAPWVDEAQTTLNGYYKFLETGATTATTNITLAATGTTRGWSGVLVATGDQYGAAAPIVTVHGSQLTVACTGTTGTWQIASSAVEL